MSIADPQFSLSEQTDLFKINYYKKSENMYNSYNVLHGRIKKRYDFTGRQRFVSTPLSFAGGVGAAVLPTANGGNYKGALIESKKVYAAAKIDRESIKASANNAGAFVQATKETVQKTVESYMRNCSRILFGDGSGILGRGVGGVAAGDNVSGAGTTGSPFIVTLDASFHLEYFEERDYVQLVTGMAAAPDNTGGAAEGGTAKTNLLEVVDVDPSTRKVSLVGTSPLLLAAVGAPLAATSGLCMQSSYLAEPQGLASVENFTSGTLYGIDFQRRWSCTTKDAGGTGVTVDKMNEVMLDVERKFGKTPNLIICHYTQFRNILALLEDQKVYNLPNKNMKGNLSFEAVEFMSTRGKVAIVVDRFCPEDKIWFLNDSFIENHHRPDFGWFDDDGTVFLRAAGEDSYEARYGGYYETFITPTAHGVLQNLAK